MDGGTFGVETTPNNDHGHATTLPIGVPYQACIQTGSDIDWYQFTVPSTGQGGYVIAAITDVPAAAEMIDQLYSASTNGLIHTTQANNPGTNVYTWFAAASGASSATATAMRCRTNTGLLQTPCRTASPKAFKVATRLRRSLAAGRSSGRRMRRARSAITSRSMAGLPEHIA